MMPQKNAMQSQEKHSIRIGLTTNHGMMDEQQSHPPKGIEYGYVKTRPKPFFIKSPLKCYLYTVDKCEFDLIEAVLAPISTTMPWICSLDCYQSALAFSVFDIPTPKLLRKYYIESLFVKNNCRKIIFWSEYARKTMENYGEVSGPQLLGKSTVVYPAIRMTEIIANDSSKRPFQFLFSGDFFRKGGANVIDAFLKVLKNFPDVRLRICSDESDFQSRDAELKSRYLRKIHQCKNIDFGRVTRDEMLKRILPATDAYLLPTYAEAFGFAILEAMAFGIPVISSNICAIPEIISDEKNGLLVNMSSYPLEKMFRGYKVDRLQEDFSEDITNQLLEKMLRLVESTELRLKIQSAAIENVRTRFSFDARNRTMKEIYKSAISSGT
jgi:glycosyltransferase involved in cell wall biosynthesis